MRPIIPCLLVIGFLILGVGNTSRAESQNSPPGIHPIVGVWRITAANKTGNVKESSLATFHEDGTAIQIDIDGTTWQGVWESAGERSATYQFVAQSPDGSGMGFSGTAEIAADGQSWLPPARTTLAPGEGAFRVTVDSFAPHGAASPQPGDGI